MDGTNTATPPTNGTVTESAIPNEVTIERNGVQWKFTPDAKKKKKGEPETIVLSPARPTNDEEYTTMLAWLSPKDAALLGFQKLRQISVNLTEAASKKGPFNLEQFTKMVQDMSPRAETNAALTKELAELQKSMVSAISDPKLAADPAAFRTKIEEIGTRMKEINETLEFRKASKEEDEDASEDEAGEEATTAAAPAVATK